MKGKTYNIRVKAQLKNWVNGKSIHNSVDNECCPDFNCCMPNNITTDEDRLHFFNWYLSDDKARMHNFLLDQLRAVTNRSMIMRYQGLKEENN